MTPLSTPPLVVMFIVATLAALALLVIGTLCACAWLGVGIEGELRTALIGFAGGLVGSLSSILVNTRTTQPPQETK